MRDGSALMLLAVLMALPIVGHSQPTCGTYNFADQRVKEIVDEERAKRKDLPAPFPKYKWNVERRDCYYIYFEFGIPEAMHYQQIFKLNRQGAIADVITEDGHETMKCPDKEFSESELGQIIRKEREVRSELAPPFPDQKIEISRLRCMYVYYEHNLPKRWGDYQAFTIDPFGAVMDFYRGHLVSK